MPFALRFFLPIAAASLLGVACTNDESSGTTTTDQATESTTTTNPDPSSTTDQVSTATSTTTNETDPCQRLTVDETLVGNFDFDQGIDEIILGRDDDGQYLLALCQPGLSTVALGANKPPQASVADIEGDGTDEVIVGTATGTSPFIGTTVAVVEGRLIDNQVPLEVTLGGSGRDGSSFGCVDTNNDGRRELVSLRYRFNADSLDDSDQVTWWRWPAGSDPDTQSETGTYDPTTDQAAIETLIDGTCGESVLVDITT